MTRIHGTIALLVFLFYLSTSTAVFTQSDRLSGLDAYVRKSMAEWRVPGLAIGVVKDDKIVFLKGYGFGRSAKTHA